jgi:hypothetical protein
VVKQANQRLRWISFASWVSGHCGAVWWGWGKGGWVGYHVPTSEVILIHHASPHIFSPLARECEYLSGQSVEVDLHVLAMPCSCCSREWHPHPTPVYTVTAPSHIHRAYALSQLTIHDASTLSPVRPFLSFPCDRLLSLLEIITVNNPL